VCNKDFSERNVKNFVVETEKLNSLIYIKAEKDERIINGKSILGILSSQLYYLIVLRKKCNQI